MCDLEAVLQACHGQWPSPQCEAAVATGGDACLHTPAFDAASAPPVAFYVCPSSRGGRLEVACTRLGFAPVGPGPAGPGPAGPVSGQSEVPTFTQSLLTLHPAGGQTFQSAGGLAGTAVQAGVLAGAYTAYRRDALGVRKFRLLETAVDLIPGEGNFVRDRRLEQEKIVATHNHQNFQTREREREEEEARASERKMDHGVEALEATEQMPREQRNTGLFSTVRRLVGR